MQFNLVGRLLGPKGLTLKRMQAETQTKMSIMGRGCMRDKKKEEELRNSDDPANLHLKDDLHVLVQAEPPYSSSKLAAGVAEVKKMLIPLVRFDSLINTFVLWCYEDKTTPSNTFEVMGTIFKSLSTCMHVLYM